MRNGNGVESFEDLQEIGVGSYPTYEEWKLFHTRNYQYQYFRSYPTYEEWKLLTIPNKS